MIFVAADHDSSVCEPFSTTNCQDSYSGYRNKVVVVKPSKMLHSLLTDAQKNLRDFLVKAKLKQPSQSNKTQPNIISRCNDGRCRTCKFIAHGTSSYTFYNTGEQRKIPHSLSCSSDNLIYLINCKRCI